MLRTTDGMVYYSSHQSSIYWNNSSMHWNEIFNLLRCKIERVLEAVSGFANPFSSIFEDNELYFLSFGDHARPGIAKNLIEADDIERKAVVDFIDSLLVKKCAFHNPTKCYKLIKFWGLRGLEKMVQFTKRNQPDESLKERLWSAWPFFYWT